MQRGTVNLCWLAIAGLLLGSSGCGEGDPGDATGGGGGEPVLLHDGPIASFTGVPDWSADQPFPLITMERVIDGDDTYWTSTVVPVFTFGADGRATKIGSLSEDARVRIWSMSSTDWSLDYSGPVGEAALEDWSLAEPTPYLVMRGESGGWANLPAGAFEDGGIKPVSSGEVRVFHWHQKRPAVRAIPRTIALADWNPDQPRPVIVLQRERNGLWNQQSAAVSDDGTVRVFVQAEDAVVFVW